jgi:hypothetical protein
MIAAMMIHIQNSWMAGIICRTLNTNRKVRKHQAIKGTPMNLKLLFDIFILFTRVALFSWGGGPAK